MNRLGTIELYEILDEQELKKTIKKYESFVKDVENLIENGKNKKIFWEKFGEEITSIKENWEIDIHLIRMELTKRMWEKDA